MLLYHASLFLLILAGSAGYFAAPKPIFSRRITRDTVPWSLYSELMKQIVSLCWLMAVLPLAPCS